MEDQLRKITEEIGHLKEDKDLVKKDKPKMTKNRSEDVALQKDSQDKTHLLKEHKSSLASALSVHIKSRN